MPVREGKARWEGTFKDGKGTLNFGSGEYAYSGGYSGPSRFEDGAGTNPEELIGAAHAGCFSMALAVDLSKAGYEPESIDTTAKVTIERVDGAQTITAIALECRGRVPGMNAEEFKETAQAAKKTCPVSRALAGVNISLQAELLS